MLNILKQNIKLSKRYKIYRSPLTYLCEVSRKVNCTKERVEVLEKTFAEHWDNIVHKKIVKNLRLDYGFFVCVQLTTSELRTGLRVSRSSQQVAGMATMAAHPLQHDPTWSQSWHLAERYESSLQSNIRPHPAACSNSQLTFCNKTIGEQRVRLVSIVKDISYLWI